MSATTITEITFHKEGKPQKSAVAKQINEELPGKQKLTKTEMRRLSRKVSLTTWESFTRTGQRLVSVHQEHHAQMFLGKGFQRLHF